MKLFIVLAFTVVSARAVASLNTILHPAFFEGRIINGQDAVKGEAPFVVSLKSGSHFCGGSIIDEHWVLTAGHCLIYNSFKVIAGLHQRSDESNVQIREVSSKKFQFVHEKYSGNVGPYDIGLIYIAEPFNLNAVTRGGFAPVAKIKLPSGKYEQTGKGKLYGWGYDNSGDLSNTLQTLETNIIGYRECKRTLPFPTLIHPTNICTYTIDTSDGACNGDSGGPLVRYTPDGAEIVGIVSWGFIPCDITKYPTVYTMTSAFSDWIQKIINNFTTGDMPYKLAKRYYINKLKSMT